MYHPLVRHNLFRSIIICCAILLYPHLSTAQQQPGTHILILHSYNRGYVWTDNIAAGMESVLNSDLPGVKLHTEYMDTKRIKGDTHTGNLYQLFKHKYKGIHFSAILASDDDALEFLLRYQPEIWPRTPVIFCGINNYSDTLLQGREEFTGVLEDVSILETLNTALTLHPQARRLCVVNDISAVGQALHAQVLQAASQLSRPLELIFLENLNLEEIETRASQLPPDSLMLFLIFFRDKSGRVFSHDESFRLIKAKTRVPIYSIWDIYLGQGMVGGMLTSGYSQGELAAKLALRILKGEKPSSIPVIKESPNRFMFDYQQLQRFGIAPSQLPPGSMIINRPYSFYQQNKKLVWFIFAFITIQALVIVFLMVNVAIRRRTERALRESEEKYRLLVNQIPAVVYKGYTDWSLDCFDRKIEEITGYLKEDFDSRRITWRDLIFPEDLEQAKKNLLEGLKTNRFYLVEHRIRKKTGEVRWIQARNRIIQNAKGKIDYISGVFFDITEHRHLEEQLAKAQRMEAVGMLAGGIAHDFNNLLTAIMGYAEIMTLDSRPDDPRSSYPGEIIQAAKRGSSLTSQLLAFSRKQILQPKVINLNTIVTEMDQMLRRLIGEDIDLVISIEQELGRVKADPGQLEQVIMNLALNARDAMPQGGSLTIETANVYLDEEYTQSRMEVTPGLYVMLAMSDTGLGMDDNTMTHIFEPFFTTKEIGKGTGLGLATVYGIVRQSGGHIWVYSEANQGTTFKIFFPQVEEAEMVKPPPEPLKSLHGEETILVVEDDTALRNLISRALTKFGYSVFEASHGGEALQICEKEKGAIKLMVTDVVMPKMGGRELTDRLATLHPEMKVLYMSGYTANAIVHHGVLDPDLYFIQKPFSVLGLAQKVREVLEDNKG